MSLFLFKPHVRGPEYVTSPDFLIDSLAVAGGGPNAEPAPTALLSTAYALEVPADGATARGGLYVCAAGAGAIFGPALEVTCPATGPRYVLARQALRGRHEIDALPSLGLTLGDGAATREVVLPDADAIAAVMTRIDRGRMELLLDAGPALPIGPGAIELTLTRPEGAPSLTHRLELQALEQRHWSEPTAARYTVGPTTGEVEHYV